MEAIYKFRVSEDYLLSAMRKYREQNWWYRPFTKYRWIIAAISVTGIICCIYYGSILGAGVFGGVLGATILDWPIAAWSIRMRLRKSPFHDDEVSVTLTSEGLRTIGKASLSEAQWSTFTKVRRFPDGLLLFRGPHLFNWLPDEAAKEQSMVRIAEELAKTHVQDFRNV